MNAGVKFGARCTEFLLSSLRYAFLIGAISLPVIELRAQVVSVVPLGGRQGTSFEVEMLGSNLDGAYGIWFDCLSLKAEVLKTEQIKPETESGKGSQKGKKNEIRNRILLRVNVAPDAKPGVHTFRVLSSDGVSDPFSLLVNSDPVTTESDVPHNKPGAAQLVSSPVVVNGRIKQEGEVDFYSFDARPGQKLVFETDTRMKGFDPVLALYQPSGSWFDPSELKRLALGNEVEADDTKASRLVYRFDRAGRYTVAIREFVGQGGPGYAYQLRITPLKDSDLLSGEKSLIQSPAHQQERPWLEHDYSRNLAPDRLKLLESRTVPPSPSEPAPKEFRGISNKVGNPQGVAATQESNDLGPLAANANVNVVHEQGLNRKPSSAPALILPALIEGTIEHPADVDYFRFKVKAGDSLAFEIQTPVERPPRFNPWLRVIGPDANEVFTNIFKRISGDGDNWSSSMEPKTVYTFKQAGEYYLAIRDATSRFGSEKFLYRVLVRPQIPHMGEIEVKEDHINLTAGEARKLTVTTEREEGFGGDVAVWTDNLPSGVEALPSTEIEPPQGTPFATMHPERFVAHSQKLTITLLAAKDAPATATPVFIKVRARPIVNGRPGDAVSVQSIPLMVIRPARAKGTMAGVRKN